jgi:hypothetical protein
MVYMDKTKGTAWSDKPAMFQLPLKDDSGSIMCKYCMIVSLISSSCNIYDSTFIHSTHKSRENAIYVALGRHKGDPTKSLSRRKLSGRRTLHEGCEMLSEHAATLRMERVKCR